ncbi:MAG: Rpn family recombination-promoting nuclease/putative transposase [Lachnospiraceae bacterium]|nr:Rpn family recombination-promoting nuclease/putative transposase [Lachnospiraceae bacterium]
MSKQRVMKNYEELMFRDDFMFGKVMEDPELCREVLECLLQRPVGELKKLQTQREFRYSIDGKPIRLDVYNEDDNGVIYDAEMENLNHKSVESHLLPKRSRYYQGAIDIDYMDQGNSYKKLPESNVMFICTFDPFGRGLSSYTFQERCVEDSELALNDGTTKIFYNCSYDGEDISKDLKELYDYVRNGHANNKLTGKIEQAVDKGRKNALWRTQYMKEWVIIQDAKDEGIEEGAELQLIKQVCRKLKKSKSPEQIAEELDEDEVHIQVLCDIASGFAPDYDVDMILDAVLDNKMV